METLYFNFVAWLSMINVAVCLVLFAAYNDDNECQRVVKRCFKAYSYWLPVSTTVHVIAIVLSFFTEIKFFEGDGPSVLSFLCVSTFLLSPIWVLYTKQKSVFKSKKYIFTVTETKNSEKEYCNLNGYIIQDWQKYKCKMRDTSGYAIGSKIEVDVWSVPFFGAFVVGEDWDF